MPFDEAAIAANEAIAAVENNQEEEQVFFSWFDFAFGFFAILQVVILVVNGAVMVIRVNDGAGVAYRDGRFGAAPVVGPRCVRLGHGLQVDVG